MMRPLNGQSVDPSASSPYGGPAITLGELAASPGGGTLTPSSTSICPTGTNPNCVITGQYSRAAFIKGKVYVPAFEAFSSGTTILTGGGVLVFGTCK